MTIPEALEYLELATPFTKSDLKKAYREALMVWHPDRFAGNDQLLAKAEVRTKLINDAFTLLKEIPETDYPYQPQKEEPQPRQAMGPLPPGTPHQSKAPPAAAKSNAGSWFIVFTVLTVLGAAAFFKFQSGAPEPEIVAEAPVADAGHVIKEPDNAPALPKKTAASKDGTSSSPTLPQTPPLPAGIPAKAPASMPVVTAQPKPDPVTPVTPPRSEIDLRLEALEQAFQIATERDAWKGYSDSMAVLDKNYLAALERTLAAATSAGKLEDAIALRAEKQRLEKGETLPTDQEEGPLTAAPMLKELRKTYRATAGQYGAARNQTLHTLYDKYDQALAVFQTELTKAAKLDDAFRVKTVRSHLAETKVAGMASPPVVLASTFEKDATNDKAFTNSLGMKFVPVPGTKVSFCIHETRKSDYAKYAAENAATDASWKTAENAGIPVSLKDDHPVVNVSWDDATAFCVWLSKKERKQYRLPTDHEWSIAVGGLDQELENDSPAQKSAQIQGVYPWGGSLPPSAQDGNYLPRMVNDGYETTSPVMSFKPNRLGLFDLGGNVWEWCQDWNDSTRQERVIRGASWGNFKPDDLLSSMRGPKVQGRRHNYLGFRCVAVDGKSGNEPLVPTKPGAINQTIIPPPRISPGQSFTNILGMKFVQVPGTNVLFCIHETRKSDYAAYAATSSVDGSWQMVTAYGLPVSTADDHPVANVSWEDATAFCTWLSKKEGRTYRLPTDREWSYAVGIGSDESKDQTPAALNGKITDEFPWGKTWPPPQGAGNYADVSLKDKAPAQTVINGYTDGFAATAPVMSFPPNKLGLYDLGGNLWEWCEDWYNSEQQTRVLRGTGWSSPDHLLSSDRYQQTPATRRWHNGFRCVMEVTSRR